MATTQSARVATKLPTRVAHDEGLVEVYSDISFAANPTTGDNVQMIKVPAGAIILGVTLATDQLDSSTGVSLSVGDAASSTRFIAAQTTAPRASGGGIVSTTNPAGVGFTYTVDDFILLTIVAAATTFVAGKVRITCRYTVQA